MTCVKPCASGKKFVKIVDMPAKALTSGDIFKFLREKYFVDHNTAQQALVKKFSAKVLNALGNWQELVNQHFSDRG